MVGVSPHGKDVTVNERHLLQALKMLRALRAWAVHTRADPWAIRQALLMAIHLDTKAARMRGVPAEALRTFDRLVEENAEEIQLKEVSR